MGSPQDSFPPFNAQYTFSLLDAVKDVPEYLVHFPTLQRYAFLLSPWSVCINVPLTMYLRLAAEVGLQLYKKWTFHELFCEKVKTDMSLQRLLFHMEAVDENGTISPDEWEAASTSHRLPVSLFLMETWRV